MISGSRRGPEDAESPAEAVAGGDPRAACRVVVGLGNPGREYAHTRHNVGFDALDRLAVRLGIVPSHLRAGGSRLGRWYRDPERRFALLWPLTYMNRSGRAVAAALREVEAPPAALLVLVDDFHLPLGVIRVRPGGSAGGHKGLLSIEGALGTQEYPRLRLGVGDPRGDAVEHVLSPFRRAEAPVVDEALDRVSWAAEDWVRGISIEELQARYNRRAP